MTWADLTATAAAMRAGNEDVLPEEDYDDDAIVLLYQESAKAEMLLDLEGVTGTSDADTINEITDENTAFLQAALSHKQLAIFYRRHDSGEGSANRRRLDHYERLYRYDVSRFGNLIRTSGAVVRSTFIRR